MGFRHSDYAFVDTLRARWRDIRDEFSAIDPSELSRDGLTDVEGWTAYGLYYLGRRLDAACALAPLTTALVEQVPFMTSAGFAVLDDGAHYGRHIDRYHPRFAARMAERWGAGIEELRRLHLPLIASPGCVLTVGHERREFVPGEPLVFRNAMDEHEVENRSGRARVVLLLDFLCRAPRASSATA